VGNTTKPIVMGGDVDGVAMDAVGDGVNSCFALGYRSKTKPWAHQVQAFEFMVRILTTSGGVLLGNDMGTGKTKSGIDIIQSLHIPRVLALVPKAVAPVWDDQFRLHDLGPRHIYILSAGTIKDRAKKVKQIVAQGKINASPFVVVINYEAASLEPLRSTLLEQNWVMVILDEAHRIKAPGGKASWLCKALGRRAQYRIAMSGTIMPHSPMDLYASYRFLDPTIFGTSFTAFKARYAVLGGYKDKQVVAFKNMEEFEQKLHSIMFRVKSEDVLDLPETQDMRRTFDLPEKVQKMYDSFKEEFCVMLESGTATAANVLVKLLRLQQITSGYLKLDDDIETGAIGTIQQLICLRILMLRNRL